MTSVSRPKPPVDSAQSSPVHEPKERLSAAGGAKELAGSALGRFVLTATSRRKRSQRLLLSNCWRDYGPMEVPRVLHEVMAVLVGIEFIESRDFRLGLLKGWQDPLDGCGIVY
jgi:hypothetical protein